MLTNQTEKWVDVIYFPFLDPFKIVHSVKKGKYKKVYDAIDWYNGT